MQLVGLLSWVVFGLLAAAVGRSILPPARRPAGFSGAIGLAVAGVLGALLSGWLATLLGFGGISGFDLRSLLMAIPGSVLVLYLYSFVITRSHRRSASRRAGQDSQAHTPRQIHASPSSKQNAGPGELVFISYRREDAADVTGRMYDRLVARFGRGNVFKDVDSIPLGVDFRHHLDTTLSRCSALLVVIGKNWLGEGSPVTAESNRLQDPRDFVRVEIEIALKRDIPLIPVFVQGAGIPAEESLPSTLHALQFRNGIAVRPDPDFDKDMQRLLASLEHHLQQP